MCPGAYVELWPPLEFEVGTGAQCSDKLVIDLTFEEVQDPDPCPFTDRFVVQIPVDCSPCLTDRPWEVTGLKLRREGSDIELQWNPNSRASAGYNFYMADAAAEPDLSQLGKDHGDTPFLTALPAETATVYRVGVDQGLLYYRVRAEGQAGEGP